MLIVGSNYISCKREMQILPTAAQIPPEIGEVGGVVRGVRERFDGRCKGRGVEFEVRLH
jgi:hypothetical protein